MNVVIHEAAGNEALDAAYDLERAGAGPGISFLSEYETVVLGISERPERYPLLETVPLESGIRRGITKRFPYLVIDEIKANHCRIIVVAHASRRPNYWSLRRRGI